MTCTPDSFETELLGELRAVVEVRSASTETSARQVRAARPSSPRRSLRTASVLAAAAATAVVVMVPGFVGSPAFAVQEGPHGTIEVQVERLEDAAGLEAALHELGVRADIQYLGNSMQCTEPRFESGPSAPGSATRFSVGEGIELTLDRRDLEHGATVVIAASRIPHGIHAEVGVALGSVAPCRPVPLPADDTSA